MNPPKQKTSAQNKLQNRLGLIFLVLIVIWIASTIWQGSLLDEGTMAPVWKLPEADDHGNFLSLEDQKGKVVLLDFWSTTCPPCLREIDELNQLHTKFQGQPLKIVGISAGGETKDEILAFRKRKPINYTLAVDDGSVSNAYKVESLPTVYIIDKEGKIAFAKRGFVDGAALRNALKLLLDL